MAEPTKAMTLRLPAELADDLEVVAYVNEQPISTVVREAIAAHIEARTADPAFRARLGATIDRAKALLGDHNG